ncbi:hypothetical protein [Planococcus sp. CAU13]
MEAVEMLDQPGVITNRNTADFTKQFIEAVLAHCHWNREIN